MKTSTAPLPPLRSVKVLDQLRERIRYLHYSLRTEEAYVHWVRAFIRLHGVRHPATQSWRIHHPCPKNMGVASNGRFRKGLPVSATGRIVPHSQADKVAIPDDEQ
jgi:hypothetical protein